MFFLSLFACSNEAETISEQVEVGCDPVVEDTGTDSVEIVPGSSSDDETDTGVVIEDEPACEFTVSTWDGEVVMGNTVSISLGQGNPDGSEVPGVIEVLRLLLTVDDPECESMSLTGLTVFGVWTDNADTDWAPASMYAVDGPTGESYEAAISQPGGIVYAGFDLDVEIEAGPANAHGISFFADVSGASAAEDDMVKFDLYLDSLGVQDESTSRVLKHDGIGGNWLVF